MSGWRTYHPPRDPETLAGRIFTVVQHAKGGIAVEEIARRVGAGYTYKSVVARCHAMVTRGQLAKEHRHKPGTRRVVAYFRPPSGPGSVVPRRVVLPVSAIVRRVLERQGDGTVGSIAHEAGLSRKATRDGLHRLVLSEEVERVGAGKLQRFRLTTADDDWTPQPYVHPIRARALGLTTRRVA